MPINNNSNTIATPDDLKLAGFTSSGPKQRRGFCISIEGHHKSGKTWFAMSAPGPMCVVGVTETGTARVVDKWRSKGKVIYECLRNRIQVTGVKSEGGNRMEYKKELDTINNAIKAGAHNPKVRTIVVDTGADHWELARYAEFGRQSQREQAYIELNAEYKRFWTDLCELRQDLIIAVIHPLKKEYKGGKKKAADGTQSDESNWTGNYERSGFKSMPYIVDVLGRANWYDPVFDDEGNMVSPGEFGFQLVGMNRINPEAYGLDLRGEMCTFANMAVNLFPESDLEDWE